MDMETQQTGAAETAAPASTDAPAAPVVIKM